MTTTAAVVRASVEEVEVSAFTVPTDAPEADGTLTWDATTIVVVHVVRRQASEDSATRTPDRGWKVVVLEKGPFWDPDRDWVSDEAGSHKLYWTEERIIDGRGWIAMLADGANLFRPCKGERRHHLCVST